MGNFAEKLNLGNRFWPPLSAASSISGRWMLHDGLSRKGLEVIH